MSESENWTKTANLYRSVSRSITRLNSGVDFRGTEEKQATHVKDSIKNFYDLVAAKSTGPGLLWNWGFHSDDLRERIRKVIPCFDTHTVDGLSEQLYYYALQATKIQDFSDMKLLEVGCGLGEGLNFLSRAENFKEMVGLDISQNAVDRANGRFSRKHVTFCVGDAEKLPFEDGSIDVVINIESSHNYPHPLTFLQEVERVLKPGGYFSHVDLFTKERHEQFNQTKSRTGLEWSAETDITPYVKEAIKRRMLPNSIFREKVRSISPGGFFLTKLYYEPSLMSIYGADLIDYPHNLFYRCVSKFFRSASADHNSSPLVYDRYVHNIARKN